MNKIKLYKVIPLYICVCIYTHTFFLIFFSITVCHRVLNAVSSAVQ